mmetsp:Transcript_24058/g.45736  ORF Transcript_24058/g.45736 Transcript_24058/m.45736 type:complete len:406 (+) Transcript_24058:1580-2797(+)
MRLRGGREGLRALLSGDRRRVGGRRVLMFGRLFAAMGHVLQKRLLGHLRALSLLVRRFCSPLRLQLLPLGIHRQVHRPHVALGRRLHVCVAVLGSLLPRQLLLLRGAHHAHRRRPGLWLLLRPSSPAAARRGEHSCAVGLVRLDPRVVELEASLLIALENVCNPRSGLGGRAGQCSARGAGIVCRDRVRRPPHLTRARLRRFLVALKSEGLQVQCRHVRIDAGARQTRVRTTKIPTVLARLRVRHMRGGRVREWGVLLALLLMLLLLRVDLGMGILYPTAATLAIIAPNTTFVVNRSVLESHRACVSFSGSEVRMRMVVELVRVTQAHLNWNGVTRILWMTRPVLQASRSCTPVAGGVGNHLNPRADHALMHILFARQGMVLEAVVHIHAVLVEHTSTAVQHGPL